MPFLFTASAFCNNKSKAVQAEDLSNPDKSFFQKLGLGDQDIYYPRYDLPFFCKLVSNAYYRVCRQC